MTATVTLPPPPPHPPALYPLFSLFSILTNRGRCLIDLGPYLNPWKGSHFRQTLLEEGVDRHGLRPELPFHENHQAFETYSRACAEWPLLGSSFNKQQWSQMHVLRFVYLPDFVCFSLQIFTAEWKIMSWKNGEIQAGGWKMKPWTSHRQIVRAGAGLRGNSTGSPVQTRAAFIWNSQNLKGKASWHLPYTHILKWVQKKEVTWR